MKTIERLHLVVFLPASLVFFLVLQAGGGERGVSLKTTMEKYKYWENPRVCSGCHWDKYSDWSRSQMSRSYTGDFFQAQFFKSALRDGVQDPDVKGVHEGCFGCHSPSAYLSGDIPAPPAVRADNFWDQRSGDRYMAERGVFCDFCHTIEGYEGYSKGREPFLHNYQSAATPEVDPKRADLEFPWSPYHETELSELHEEAEFCGICHNELNPHGLWIKATHLEYLKGPYPNKNIVCQDCHMPPRQGKPAKMGPARDENSEHWFGGGFTTFVQGAAKVSIHLDIYELKGGQKVGFDVEVYDVATGHKFPTGASEERDVWLHVGVYDMEGNELDHIKVPPNPEDPHDRYFITSNSKTAYPTHSKYSDPIIRDSLVEGDRLYHSAFLDSDGNMTYAQWHAVKDVENRLDPLERRLEHYVWNVPERLKGKTVTLRAVLSYRRMPDSYANYLGIRTRPKLEVGRDEVRLRIQ